MHPGSCIDGAVSCFIEWNLLHQSHHMVCIIVKLKNHDWFSLDPILHLEKNDAC